MADAKCITANRGGALYEVTCLRTGVDARTAIEADFFTIRLRAANSLSARLIARNERDDCAIAFDAKVIEQ